MKVDMRPAYEWTCDACGRDQFVSCMTADFSEEDRLEMARGMGLVEPYATEIPEELSGEFQTYPDEVTCQFCGETFETKHHTEMEDDAEGKA